MMIKSFFWREMPMVRLLFPFAMGVALGALGPSFPMGWALPVLNLLILAFLAKRKMPFQWRWIFGALLFPMLLMMGYRISELNSELLRPQHFGNLSRPNSIISGYIAEAPSNAHWTRLVLEVNTITNDSLKPSQYCSGRLMLFIEPTDSSRGLRPGDHLVFSSDIIPVPPPANPDGFDYQRYLFYKNIHFQSFVKTGQWKILDMPPCNRLQRWAYDLSSRFVRLFEKNIPSERECAVAVALVIGKKDDLTNDLRESYAQTGAMHLLAVSGMHVALLATMLHIISRRIPGRGKAAILLRNLIPLLGAWVFALVTGLSGSILRAAVMFTLTFIGAAWRRDSNLYNTLAGSAFLLLAFDPWLLFDAGFQLSYLAVLGIALYQRPISKMWRPRWKILRWIWELNAVSLAAQLSTLPLTLYYFHQFPLYFWLSALIGVPLSTLALPLGMAIFAFGDVPFLNSFLGMAMSATVWLMNAGILLTQKLPFAVIPVGDISFFEMVLMYGTIGFGTWAFAKQMSRWLMIGLFCFLIMNISQQMRHWRQRHQIHAIAYQLKKAAALEFMIGTNSYSIPDTAAFNHPNLVKATEDHRRASGIQKFVTIREISGKETPFEAPNFWTDGTFVLFNNTRFAIINALPPLPEKPLKIDMLILRGNPRLKIEDLLQRFEFQELVIDNTNSSYSAKKWKESCEKTNKKVWVIKEQGAWTMDYLKE